MSGAISSRFSMPRATGRDAHLTSAAAAISLSLLLPSLAAAGLCGDDIGGSRVPCRCGDVVASDTVLRPSDPVTQERCPGIGLLVRADALAETITLNLGGLSLVGQGRAVGILVQRGGSDGAVILGGDAPRLGEVVGFELGVVAPNQTVLRRVERLVAKGNRRDGFWLRQAGIVALDLAATRNGGSGMRISGRGGRFEGIHAGENHGRGIVLMAPGAVVSGEAHANRLHGIVSSGARASLVHVEAHGNGRDGVAIRRPVRARTSVQAFGNARRNVAERPAIQLEEWW